MSEIKNQETPFLKDSPKWTKRTISKILFIGPFRKIAAMPSFSGTLASVICFSGSLTKIKQTMAAAGNKNAIDQANAVKTGPVKEVCPHTRW